MYKLINGIVPLLTRKMTCSAGYSVAAVINNQFIQDDNVYGKFVLLCFFGSNYIGAFELGRKFYRLNIDHAQMYIFNALHKMKKRKEVWVTEMWRNPNGILALPPSRFTFYRKTSTFLFSWWLLHLIWFFFGSGVAADMKVNPEKELEMHITARKVDCINWHFQMWKKSNWWRAAAITWVGPIILSGGCGWGDVTFFVSPRNGLSLATASAATPNN